MQLDAPKQNSDTPQSDPPELDARAALEAFGRLPTAAATTPPSALSIQLPEGDCIDCYDLAARIADVVETPCCKVETVGRTRRAIDQSTGLALGTRRASTGPDLKICLAAYRGAPYSPEWDPALGSLSLVQHRRLAERARRMQDFQQRVKRGILSVFTQAHDASVAVGVLTYMTRSAAEQYLRSCGFQVSEQPANTQIDLPHLPVETKTEIVPETESRDEPATVLDEAGPVAEQLKPHIDDLEPTAQIEQIEPLESIAIERKARTKSSRALREALPQELNTGSRFLRIDEVLERTGLGRTSIYNRMNPSHPDFDRTFPERFTVGRRAVRFLESHLEQWIAQQQTKK